MIASSAASSALGALPRRSQEAVYRVVRVEVHPADHPFVVETVGESALSRTCTGAGSVECGDPPIRTADESVVNIVRVNVRTPDYVKKVEDLRQGALAGSRTCARDIELGERAVGVTDPTVKDAIGIHFESRNKVVSAHAVGVSALAGTGPRAGSIDNDEGAVGFTEVTVQHVVIVDDGARHRPLRIQAYTCGRTRALARTCARTGTFIGQERSIPITQEDVSHIRRVPVVAGNLSREIDVVGERALAGAIARARSIELREIAVCPTDKAVNYVAGVNVWDPLESTCRHASLSIL